MFYAIGNIGDSKKTDDSRLTDPSDPYECVLEVMDNTLPNSTMPTGKVDEKGAPVYPIAEAEWCEGNSAYDSLHADKFDESKSSDKENGLADTYGWRYIYEDGSDEENDAAKAYVEQQWKDFYKFVVTSSDEDFHAHLGDWCVLDSVLYYYLFTLRYTMTDNHAKNSFWHYGKSNDLDAEGNPIRKWDLCFDYDNDTALGIDNYGRMSYRYGYEEIDYVDGTQDWVWNAPQHVLFLRIRELFDAELCELYARLESEGCWSATSLINEFNEWQAQFPEELWRLDIQRKYIRTYTTSYINDKAYPEFLTERANGRKKSQRSQFERNQEKYMSSKFSGTVASADDIILRCSVPNTELAVQPNFDMHLTPYSHVYLNVKYNTAPPVRVRAVPNQEYTIEYTDALADIIEIYSASCLKSVGDLSACYLTNGTFAQATKIRELILGSGVEGYKNSNVMTLGLGSNELLNKLDIQNMSGLTHSLDLSGLKNLEELYAFGSGTSGVIFADGGNIRIAEIPDVGTLQMKNLNNLTDEGFEASSTYSLSRLVAEYSELDLVDLIENSPNLRQVRLIGVDWNLPSTSLLERLYGLAGVTNTGANADQSVLTGKVVVPSIKEYDYKKYTTVWPDLEIDYNGNMTLQYEVTFVNHDGTVLEVQYVDAGSAAVDPTKRADNPIIPIRESSISHDYTFESWSWEGTSPFETVFSNKTVTATYSESLREYSITYYTMGADGKVNFPIETYVGKYGEYIPYAGETPTYTGAEKEYTFYLFNRWDKSGFIDGDKEVHAIFDKFAYTDGCFNGKELKDMSPVEIYALVRMDTLQSSLGLLGNDDRSVLSAHDEYNIRFGNDVSFDDVKAEMIIEEKTEFNGTDFCIDTGIRPFEQDEDFVLAIDYEVYSGNTSGSILVSCSNEGAGAGFRIICDSTGPRFRWGSKAEEILTDNDSREMLVIRHKKGERTVTVYKSSLNSAEVTKAVLTLGDSDATTHSFPLLLGCHQRQQGNYINFAKGAIHWCKLWHCDFGEKTCTELAEWIHENVGFKVVDMSNRYYVDGTSNQELTSVTLMATNLLEKNRAWNSTSTTAGGWADSVLNNVLNNRLYKAVPQQVRMLLKKMLVKSSEGNRSENITTSGCYIAIPSIYEVYATGFNVSPYNLEVLDGDRTFSIMSNNGERIRYHEDGIADAYWTRSPYPSGGVAYYVHYVKDDGSVATGGTTSARGVAIIISF